MIAINLKSITETSLCASFSELGKKDCHIMILPSRAHHGPRNLWALCCSFGRRPKHVSPLESDFPSPPSLSLLLHLAAVETTGPPPPRARSSLRFASPHLTSPPPPRSRLPSARRPSLFPPLTQADSVPAPPQSTRRRLRRAPSLGVHPKRSQDPRSLVGAAFSAAPSIFLPEA